MSKFKDKNVIITGASKGIGFETAKIFLKEGANISICSKNSKNLKNALKKLNKIKTKNQQIIYKVFNISNENKIKDFVKYSIDKFKQIHILINNAGVYGPKGETENVKWKEFKKVFDINFFGSVIFSRLLIKHFKKKNYGKIVQLAGGGIAGSIPRINAYGASKIAIVRYMQSLSDELKKYNININSISPGAINTGMLDEIITAGDKKVGAHYYKKAIKQKLIGGSPYKKATDLIIFLSSEQSSFLKGKIIHALWDDWNNFKKYKKKIINSDFFTLKRTNPYDRGYKWGMKKSKYNFDKLFAPAKFQN